MVGYKLYRYCFESLNMNKVNHHGIKDTLEREGDEFTEREIMLFVKILLGIYLALHLDPLVFFPAFSPSLNI